jgi:hypothetical protein
MWRLERDLRNHHITELPAMGIEVCGKHGEIPLRDATTFLPNGDCHEPMLAAPFSLTDGAVPARLARFTLEWGAVPGPLTGIALLPLSSAARHIGHS